MTMYFNNDTDILADQLPGTGSSSPPKIIDMARELSEPDWIANLPAPRCELAGGPACFAPDVRAMRMESPIWNL